MQLNKDDQVLWQVLGFNRFCKEHIVHIGYYDGFRVGPSSITEKNIAVFLYKNSFCLIWKSNGISFKKAIEELKLNFKVFYNVNCDKHGKLFEKLEYKLKKVQPQLTKMIVYDKETFNTVKLAPYANCIYRLIKLSD